jgi:hypothetical protein
MVDFLIEELIMCHSFIKISNFIVLIIIDSFYVHGGQDINEGSYGDLWKLNLPFLENVETEFRDENEIYDTKW